MAGHVGIGDKIRVVHPPCVLRCRVPPLGPASCKDGTCKLQG
jgi:hypothetical protein